MRAWIALIVLAQAIPAFGGQGEPRTNASGFEVASVKQNRSGNPRGTPGLQIGDRYTVTNTTLRALIRGAYELRDFQLIGGPDWINSDRFDVNAKAEDGTFPTYSGLPSPEMVVMLRNMLAERFRLVVHTETRDLPAYALVLAAGGTPGPQLRPALPECIEAAQRAVGGLAKLNERMACALSLPRPGYLIGTDLPISQLAGVLAGFLQRAVVDRTGLTERYALELSWSPDTGSVGAPLDPSGASLFTALQEQLGLKLESTRAPAEVVVIDSVEPPTPD